MKNLKEGTMINVSFYDMVAGAGYWSWEEIILINAIVICHINDNFTIVKGVDNVYYTVNNYKVTLYEVVVHEEATDKDIYNKRYLWFTGLFKFLKRK